MVYPHCNGGIAQASNDFQMGYPLTLIKTRICEICNFVFGLIPPDWTTKRTEPGW